MRGCINEWVHSPITLYWAQAYALTVEGGSCMQKRFSEFEKLYERTKPLVPESLGSPPRRKILMTEAKLVEKRTQWITTLCQSLLQKHSRKLVPLLKFSYSYKGHGFSLLDVYLVALFIGLTLQESVKYFYTSQQHINSMELPSS